MYQTTTPAAAPTPFATRRLLPLAAAILAAPLALAPASPTWAVQDSAAADTVSLDLTARLWDDSLQSDVEGVYTVLHTVSSRAKGREGAAGVVATVDTVLNFLHGQAQERLETYTQNMKELESEMEKGNYREALAKALAAHEAGLESGLKSGELLALRPETELPFKESILADPRVIELVSRSRQAARDAEERGEWIVAQDLFYRLNTLIDHRFQEDLMRVSYRLGLLRLYAPNRLDDLMDAHLKSIGEEPRPRYAFKEIDSWDVHLKGVTRTMVLDALHVAVSNHLSQTPYPPLLIGGLKALETLATTTDLKETFTGLGDPAAVRRFTTFLRGEIEYWQSQDRADRSRATRLIERVEQANRESVNLPAEVLYHEFGDGSIAVLDEFTDMIWPDELHVFNRQLDGSFSGVGIQIIIDKSNQLTIVTPLKNSPAHRAGILAGDQIIAVDGRSTVGITTSQAIDQITGPRGTPVTLTIRRKDVENPIDFTLVRADIPIETVKGWRLRPGNEWDFFMDREAGIGYMRLTGFMRQTVDEFDTAITAMGPHLNGLIIDLRFNPGGQLQAVIDLCNRFVSRGVLVSTEGPGRRTTRTHSASAHRTSKRLAEVPIVVLINEGSASASEIMAGCLRDHQRAIVVGTRSYGKGSVQQIANQIDGGKALLRLTREHYVLPGGDRIHRNPESTEWGVQPHLTVRMTPRQVTESIDIIREADILPDAEEAVTEEMIARRDPNRLLTENLDLQLQTAALLIRSRLASTAEGRFVDRGSKPQ